MSTVLPPDPESKESKEKEEAALVATPQPVVPTPDTTPTALPPDPAPTPTATTSVSLSPEGELTASTTTEAKATAETKTTAESKKETEAKATIEKEAEEKKRAEDKRAEDKKRAEDIRRPGFTVPVKVAAPEPLKLKSEAPKPTPAKQDKKPGDDMKLKEPKGSWFEKLLDAIFNLATYAPKGLTTTGKDIVTSKYVTGAMKLAVGAAGTAVGLVGDLVRIPYVASLKAEAKHKEKLGLPAKPAPSWTKYSNPGGRMLMSGAADMIDGPAKAIVSAQNKIGNSLGGVGSFIGYKNWQDPGLSKKYQFDFSNPFNTSENPATSAKMAAAKEVAKVAAPTPLSPAVSASKTEASPTAPTTTPPTTPGIQSTPLSVPTTTSSPYISNVEVKVIKSESMAELRARLEKAQGATAALAESGASVTPSASPAADTPTPSSATAPSASNPITYLAELQKKFAEEQAKNKAAAETVAAADKAKELAEAGKAAAPTSNATHKPAGPGH